MRLFPDPSCTVKALAWSAKKLAIEVKVKLPR